MPKQRIDDASQAKIDAMQQHLETVQGRMAADKAARVEAGIESAAQALLDGATLDGVGRRLDDQGELQWLWLVSGKAVEMAKASAAIVPAKAMAPVA